MYHTPNRANNRPNRGGQHDRQASDYVYQAATIAAALLLLLTAAVV